MFVFFLGGENGDLGALPLRYNPDDFKNMKVSNEIEELFNCITRCWRFFGRLYKLWAPKTSCFFWGGVKKLRLKGL